MHLRRGSFCRWNAPRAEQQEERYQRFYRDLAHCQRGIMQQPGEDSSKSGNSQQHHGGIKPGPALADNGNQHATTKSKEETRQIANLGTQAKTLGGSKPKLRRNLCRRNQPADANHHKQNGW